MNSWPGYALRIWVKPSTSCIVIRRTMRAFELSSAIAVYKRMKHYMNPEHPRLWPWVMQTYKPTTPQTFVRNPYYFVVDTQGNQLPYLDKIWPALSGVPNANGTIATANIGCLAHLQSGTATPVRHWIELLDEALAPA